MGQQGSEFRATQDCWPTPRPNMLRIPLQPLHRGKTQATRDRDLWRQSKVGRWQKPICQRSSFSSGRLPLLETELIIAPIEPQPHRYRHPASRADQPIRSACRQQTKSAKKEQPSRFVPAPMACIEKKYGSELQSCKAHAAHELTQHDEKTTAVNAHRTDPIPFGPTPNLAPARRRPEPASSEPKTLA